MIRGSIVALVTPMSENGAIDYSALNRLVDFHLREGSHGLVAVGTTGECSALDFKEHLNVIRHIVERVGGRLPVIAGTGSNSTREAIALTAAAADAGADACLLVTPYYVRPTQEGLYQHFAAIAKAVPIPQILYNVPARTACDLLPNTVSQLAELDTIVGIKEATGDLVRARALLPLAADGFALYSGDDASAAEFMLLGGQGNISVTANVAPRAMAKLCEAALAGDAAQARALQRYLQPLHAALGVETNPIAVKWALQRMKLIGAGIRAPLTWLGHAHEALLCQAMDDCLIPSQP
ncbi:MAG TPA: 4-hydroxy-tetrahydrodipicolinate synthase [Pseudomonas sp.]|nr:4-hydroxy-tetrahydrodipicolinate synthase [Pseudomonas sp.]